MIIQCHIYRLISYMIHFQFWLHDFCVSFFNFFHSAINREQELILRFLFDGRIVFVEFRNLQINIHVVVLRLSKRVDEDLFQVFSIENQCVGPQTLVGFCGCFHSSTNNYNFSLLAFSDQFLLEGILSCDVGFGDILNNAEDLAAISLIFLYDIRM